MENKISQQELLRQIVRPHHQVVVSGPGLMVRHDPSSLQLCMTVKRAQNGRVILLDQQMLRQDLLQRYVWKLKWHADRSGTVDGARLHQRALDLVRFPPSATIYGGLDYYKKDLRQRLGQLNSRFLRQTRIQAWPADIMHSGMQDGSVDVIFDRGTHDFVVHAELNPDVKRRGKVAANIRALAKEYRRILRAGGKAVLLFQSEGDSPRAAVMRRRFMREFEKLGMDIQHVELNDEPFRFRSNPVKSMYVYPHALVVTKKEKTRKRPK